MQEPDKTITCVLILYVVLWMAIAIHQNTNSAVKIAYHLTMVFSLDKNGWFCRLCAGRVCRAWHVTYGVIVPVPGIRGAEG